MGKFQRAALVDGHICGIRQRCAEIRQRIADDDVGLSNVDVEVVLDMLDLAREQALDAQLTLHPEWEELEEPAFEEAIRTFEQRHASERGRRRLDAREDVEFVTAFVMLLAHGVIANVTEWPRSKRHQEAVEAMEAVIEVMAFIAYVFNPTEIDGRDGEFEEILIEARERAVVLMADHRYAD